MKDTIKNIKGYVDILHYNEEMELIEELHFENLVVTTGLQWIAGRLNVPIPAIMDYIAVGTDGTPPVLSDTGLAIEIYRAPVSVSGGAVSGNSIVFNQTIPAGSATGTLQEAGIFDLSSAGTMLSRVTYPVINKGPSDTIAITWTITIG